MLYEVITTKAVDETQKEIKKYTEKAFSVLDDLSIDSNKKELLKRFGEQLMNRKV